MQVASLNATCKYLMYKITNMTMKTIEKTKINLNWIKLFV